MTAPTVKPGTRCECRDKFCPHQEAVRCIHDAVRMVTVHPRHATELVDVLKEIALSQFTMDKVTPIPLCEPCAAYHESKS